MKKQGYLLLVLLMSAFVFCSCGQKDTKEVQDQTEETTKDTKEDSKTKETKDTKKENTPVFRNIKFLVSITYIFVGYRF